MCRPFPRRTLGDIKNFTEVDYGLERSGDMKIQKFLGGNELWIMKPKRLFEMMVQ